MKKFILINIIMLYLLFAPIRVYASVRVSLPLEYKPEQQQTIENIPQIGCKAAYVVNPETGKIFYEKNAHEKMYPASTTKILTALVVLEKCKLTDTAIVSKTALDLVPSGYSNANLQVGEELTIETLLQALLIPSANEAANVLAEHVSGSVEEFANLCNNRAKELGCETLNFINPNGLHDENHYCSAYDLYLIAKECQQFDAFNEIVKTKSFKIPATSIHQANDRVFTNTNSLILTNSTSYYYPYCTGIKTGHTTPAGECLVASSSKDNINLISVVLGGGTNSKGLNERFYDTKQLFEFVYNSYSYKEIAKEKNVITNINVKKATKETSSLDAIIDTNISTIVPNNIDVSQIPSKIDIKENIVAPIEQNEVLGYVTYEVDGLNYTEQLVASHDVLKKPYWIYNSLILGAILLIILIIAIILKKRKKECNH